MRYGNYFISFYIDLDSWLWYGLDTEGDGVTVAQVERSAPRSGRSSGCGVHSACHMPALV
jgi:hypothetical protein